MIPPWTGIKRGTLFLCSPEISSQSEQVMLGLGGQRQEVLGARAGLAADPSGGAAQGMHNIHEFVAVYLVRVSQESLRSPSDLFVVRSLKQSSDVFAYLKIRERQGDEREELVQGKGCPADLRKGAPAEIPSKLQKKPKSVIFQSIFVRSWPAPALFFFFSPHDFCGFSSRSARQGRGCRCERWDFGSSCFIRTPCARARVWNSQG